LVQWSI